jgi:hypothetical protein
MKKTNTNKLMLVVATALLASSALAQEAEAPVAVRTDGLPDHLKVRIEEKAAQGQTALIRYVNSTRHIHNLRVEMVVKPGDATNVAKKEEPRKVAERTEAGK